MSTVETTKDLLTEEAFDFSFGGFGRVRSVHDVFHHGRAEVTADSAGFSLGGVCRAEKIADLSDDAVAGEDHTDHWARAHELFDFREERAICHVSVVLAQDFRSKLHHFAVFDFESSFLEAAYHFACALLFKTIGFEENEGFFHNTRLWETSHHGASPNPSRSVS